MRQQYLGLNDTAAHAQASTGSGSTSTKCVGSSSSVSVGAIEPAPLEEDAGLPSTLLGQNSGPYP